ncbi:MAG: hypothetical protein M1387_10675 [Thaumarchaeota archaeon]|nr:hypothetical protein [Nitrososphaerota archaeon]
MATTTSRPESERWKYRSRLEIVMDILQQCEDPGANITRIIRECSLSYARAKLLLEQLTNRDLLKRNPSRPNLYVVTEKGEKLQKSITTALNLLEGQRRQPAKKLVKTKEPERI